MPKISVSTPEGEVEIHLNNDRQMYLNSDKGLVIYGVRYAARLHAVLGADGKWTMSRGDRVYLNRIPWEKKDASSAARTKAETILLRVATEVAASHADKLREAELVQLTNEASSLRHKVEEKVKELEALRLELAEAEVRISVARR